MLAGDPTRSGWDHWSEYVATSRIQWCKFYFCLLNCTFVELRKIVIIFSGSVW